MRTNVIDNDGINAYKIFAKKAAKELQYSDEVVNRVEAATTVGAIQRIMTGARQRYWGYLDD